MADVKSTTHRVSPRSRVAELISLESMNTKIDIYELLSPRYMSISKKGSGQNIKRQASQRTIKSEEN